MRCKSHTGIVGLELGPKYEPRNPLCQDDSYSMHFNKDKCSIQIDECCNMVLNSIWTLK